ncbi:UDP-glucose 6-dehydrogenase [Halotydeus destructor]|nr:UDP-glucose 6-dehydrogenase [Halotydeus destructor]
MKRDLSPATSSCWSLEKQLIICNDPYDALTGAHALLVCTEWASFRELDYNKVYQIMQRPAFVFDGRRILDSAKLSKIGFHVERVGEKPVDRMANEGPQL